jgi:hypothetical protein
MFNRCAVQEAKCEKAGGHPEAEIEQIHLLEALDWLMHAQDISPYGGLSRGYSFGWNTFCPKKGWQLAHPKPTAEAIVALFDCAEAMHRIDLRQRAIDLADWLVKTQMYSGAIRGGALNEAPASEVINTALAILGWTRTAKETGSDRYGLAARNASNFLLDLHHGAAGQSDATILSAMGLALIQSGIFLEEYTCCAVGERCMSRAISFQEKNGWFHGTSRDASDHILLQTLAATVENILCGGIILDNDKYIRAARLTADILQEKFRHDNILSGQFLRDWTGDAPWSSQLGNGKMATIWIRLFQITEQDDYLSSAQRMLQILKRGQNRTSTNPGLRGGIKGCYPCDGDFGRYQTLSSATVQFINCLLLAERTALKVPDISESIIPAQV